MSGASGGSKKAKLNITFVEFQNVAKKWQQAHLKLVDKVPEIVKLRADISHQSVLRADKALGGGYSASHVLAILLEKLQEGEDQLRALLVELTRLCGAITGSGLLICTEPGEQKEGEPPAAGTIPNSFPLHAAVLRRAADQVLQQTTLDTAVVERLCSGHLDNAGEVAQAGTGGARALSVDESTTLIAALSYAPYLASASAAVSELELVLKYR